MPPKAGPPSARASGRAMSFWRGVESYKTTNARPDPRTLRAHAPPLQPDAPIIIRDVLTSRLNAPTLQIIAPATQIVAPTGKIVVFTFRFDAPTLNFDTETQTFDALDIGIDAPTVQIDVFTSVNGVGTLIFDV